MTELREWGRKMDRWRARYSTETLDDALRRAWVALNLKHRRGSMSEPILERDGDYVSVEVEALLRAVEQELERRV